MRICLGYEALNQATQKLFYYAIAFISRYVTDFLQWCSGTSAESAVWQPLAHGRVEVINKKAKDLCCKVDFSNMFHKEDGKHAKFALALSLCMHEMKGRRIKNVK